MIDIELIDATRQSAHGKVLHRMVRDTSKSENEFQHNSVRNEVLHRMVRDALNDVLTKVGDSANYSIEFLLVTEDKIQKLNNQFFHKDYPTDVLSFNYQENPELLGSIVICVEIAQKQANEANIPLEQEITDLTVHGLLHLLDYNHK